MFINMFIKKKADVVVLGGGIVGLSTARELQNDGRKVLLIDRGQPGFGCSYGNAGWLTPCFAMPLPQPGMFFKSIGWLLNPESPLYIKPEPNLLLIRWMLGFLRAMNEKQMLQSIEVLTEISKYSLKAYADLAGRNPQAFGFDQKGLLMVSATDDGIKAAIEEMELMSRHNVPGRKITAEELAVMEPSLKPGLKGGVYFPAEAHAEPLATVQTMLKEFEAAGGEVMSQTEAFEFSFADGRVESIHTTRGIIQPELVVFAMGTWSRVLAKQLRVSVPILGGKGYSMIVENFATKPQHPIMVVEKKLAITPRGNTVRMAGTLELVDQDDSITHRRVQAILKAGQQYLNVGDKASISELWRGLRPCTPDGVPMVGFSKKWSNLVYNTGHQMLGLQSAPGSGRLAADLIAGKTPLVDPRPFRPERFE
jgi:D-amino-acid dehydrogenase